MREDMFKVIVERPRRRWSDANSKDGRRARNREEAPAKVGMKHGYQDTKWLNENLRPLKRYFESQVNRPWDKVFSELCATIDTRSTVKQHVRDHVDGIVAVQTRLEETSQGWEVYVRESSWRGEYVSLGECRYKLFVHPVSGILLKNRRYRGWAKQNREQQDLKAKHLRREIDDLTQLHRFGGVWYRVTLAPLPKHQEQTVKVDGKRVRSIVHPPRWDVLCNRQVSRDRDREQLIEMYGRGGVYAIAKQKLGSGALKQFGLAGKAKAPKSGPLLLCESNRSERALQRTTIDT